MATKKAYWQPHPIAEFFPPMTTEEKAAIKEDMVKRLKRGLPPLEDPILIYEGTILDGRHRHDAWVELAAEGAADGYFSQTSPQSEDIAPDQHGMLTAWMRANSRNMVHRHIPADQKAAIFLQAIDAFPELKAVIEEITEENAARKQDGRPLVASARRGDTNRQIGEVAGVGATTMKQVKRLKDQAPDQFKAVAQGRTTVKKAIKKLGPKPTSKAQKLDGGDTPANEPPASATEWDIKFTAFGFVPPVSGKQPLDIQTGLNDGTLRMIWSGRLEDADGTTVAELTLPDAKDFTVSND